MKKVELTSFEDLKKFMRTFKKRLNAGDYFDIKVYGENEQSGHGFIFSMKKYKRYGIRKLTLVMDKRLIGKRLISGYIDLPLNEEKWKKEGIRKISIEYGEGRF